MLLREEGVTVGEGCGKIRRENRTLLKCLHFSHSKLLTITSAEKIKFAFFSEKLFFLIVNAKFPIW